MVLYQLPLNTSNSTVKRVKRGEIYFADLSNSVGSEQNGIRPVVIIQNDIGNYFSPTTIVAVITSVCKKPDMPVHLFLPKEKSKLKEDSIILFEQIKTIDKKRLIRKVSKLDEEYLQEMNKQLKISLGLSEI